MIAESDTKARSRRGTVRQPLDLLQVPGARLKIDTVATVVGLSPATIYRKVKAKEFPDPIRDGARCTRWVSDSVRTWLDARPAA